MKRKASEITKDLINLEEKRKAVKDLSIEQMVLIKKAIRICKYPTPKRPFTLLKRCGKVMVIASYIKSLQLQKQIIVSQPIRKGDSLPIIRMEA